MGKKGCGKKLQRLGGLKCGALDKGVFDIFVLSVVRSIRTGRCCDEGKYSILCANGFAVAAPFKSFCATGGCCSNRTSVASMDSVVFMVSHLSCGSCCWG